MTYRFVNTHYRMLICAGIVTVLSLTGKLTGSVYAQPMSYTITDLGTLGGSNAIAFGINNVGQITGRSTLPSGLWRAFLYQSGNMTDLGVGDGSSGLALNQHGHIVGHNSVNQAYLWQNGNLTQLGTLGGSTSFANGINDNGHIVGYSLTVGNTDTHGFIYQNGSMHDIGTLGGTGSTTRGINNYGQVVGGSYITGDSALRAFRYENGAISELGTLGGTSSIAMAINNHGDIAGHSHITGDQNVHPFIYRNGVMSDLGALGNTWHNVNDINDNGIVVGRYSDPDRAFVYDGNAIYDLNTLVLNLNGMVLREAFAINDLGQIVGHGRINSQDRAFMLTPIAVPEPTIGVLIGFATIVGILVHRRSLVKHIKIKRAHNWCNTPT